MLRIENLTYRVGGRLLFDEASATISPGHRVGFVGRNGTGKTTLLRLICGAIDADGGAVHYPARWRIGVTSQEVPEGDGTLVETVLAADHELTALQEEAQTAADANRIAEIHQRLNDKDAYSAPARAARILAGLGFSDEAQRGSCSALSGGWRMRVALAALLFTEPDLLLLDEPTNHLDLEATLWLEGFLRRYPGTVLLVSHDRDLLNRVVHEILHLEHCGLTLYQGGYDRFENTRRARIEQDASLRAKQDAQRAHIQEYVDRFRYKASKARQAQSRLKLLARMQPIPEHREEGSINFAFPPPGMLAPPLIGADRIALGYGARPVLSEVSFRLDADDRIALIGKNGNGKSTLMKLLAGRLDVMAGEVNRSGKLRVGYFAQHQTDELDVAATPLVALARKRPDDRDEQLRRHLGGFGFGKLRAETKIANLSGGEKARLLFSLMSCDKPHILLLDEPTNHLDVDSRQALIQAINAFAGAVVIVSHDPHVIELTADRFWLIDHGRVVPFDGDMADYRALVMGEGRVDVSEDDVDGTGGETKKEQRRLAAKKRKTLAPLRKKLTEAERHVAELEKTKAEMTAALADPNLYARESDDLVSLKKQLGQLEKNISQSEQQWFALQEEWENAVTGDA